MPWISLVLCVSQKQPWLVMFHSVIDGMCEVSLFPNRQLHFQRLGGLLHKIVRNILLTKHITLTNEVFCLKKSPAEAQSQVIRPFKKHMTCKNTSHDFVNTVRKTVLLQY